MESALAPTPARTPWLALAALPLGGLCFASAWLGAAVRSGGRAGWMALAAAALVVGLLRITGAPRGGSRALIAGLATAAYLAVGEWLVACLPIGASMGQSPVEAAHRIGLDFGWLLIQLGNRPADWLWMVVAMAAAVWLGR